MNHEVELKRQFDAEEDSFLLLLRCELKWSEDAFKELTTAMYHVASKYQDAESIPTWIANGFWYCDTWVREWTSHENFPRPGEDYYHDSLELIRDLAYYLFMSESPYEDNTLERHAIG